MAMFVIKGGKKIGPLNLKEIKTKLVKGEISEEDTAYIDSIDEECRVKEIPGVFGREQGFRNTGEIGLYRNSDEDKFGYYDVEYASVERRFFALLLDGIFLGALPVVGIAALVYLDIDPKTYAWAIGGFLFLELLYFPVLEGSQLRGTLGKRLLKIVVCEFDGEPIGKKAAFIRLLCRFLSVLSLGVGYVMPFFTKRHQALHDKIAGSIVIRDD